MQASAGTGAEAKAETTGRARNRATAESRVLATPSAGAAEHESGEEPNARIGRAKEGAVATKRHSEQGSTQPELEHVAEMAGEQAHQAGNMQHQTIQVQTH